MKASQFLLPLLLLILSPLAQARFGLKEFKALSAPKQRLVLLAYKQFLRDLPGELGEDAPRKTVFFSLIESAYADSGKYNCFYAGWPSVKVAVSSSRSLCSSPQRGNSSYADGDCGPSALQCNPLLFGSGLCAQTGSQKQRNSAFSQCEQNFKSEGRKDSDIVKQFSDPRFSLDAQDFFATLEAVCGPTDAPPICRSLERRIDEIMADVDSEDVAEAPLPAEEEIRKPFDLLSLIKDGTPEVGDVDCEEEEKKAEDVVVSPVTPSREVSSTGSLRSISDVLSAVRSSPLKYVGRDYPAGSLGSGGNLSCVFENEKVYVVLDGCRPTSSQRMSAFLATTYFKDGSVAKIYVDNEQNDYNLGDPFSGRGWTFDAYEAEPIPAQLPFAQVSQRLRAASQATESPGCFFKAEKNYCVGDQFDRAPCTRGQMYGTEKISCRCGADSQKSALESGWRSPGGQLRELQTILLSVPR